jgi:ubiquinone/menaquinone biosynthesis C-methylase UbiE
MQTDRQLTDRTSKEHWDRAQAWECGHWVREQKQLAKFGKNQLWRLLSAMGFLERYRGDDRNRWWQGMFDNYSFLPSTVANALEVGCGPYTNMRLIQKACRADHLCLSDPLIRTYVRFKMTFVSQMYREAACCLDDHPLEQLPFADRYFDLSVMINVLDHVQDANACMKNLLRVTRAGGYLILGQDLTNEEDLARHPEGLATGHPITLNEEWFKPYLGGQFDVLLNKVLPRQAGWAPEWHYGTLVFAGRRRS